MTDARLLDSSIWIQHMRGYEPTVQRVHDLTVTGLLRICEPVVMELLAGVFGSADRRVVALVRQAVSLPFDPDLDFRVAADLMRRVRASGHTLRSPVDALIAAVALRHPDVVLVHDDVDFERIAAVAPLRQERWTRAG